QQHEPVKRLVAVKLIKAGMDSRQVLARFEAERQALALMDHPHIAKVLDGGAMPDGRPFFVMELVKGVPLTRYCDEQHLTPRQRLELFLPVCQAIQHAHHKGIIHRDIKPSNVLVALYDDKAVPKVIDFGVAKAVSEPLTERTAQTGLGAVVGTLEYMSPEQASFGQLDVDTRSDIYALGVLLYELLVGSPPFGRKELEKAGLLEMLRVIREQEPQRPSTRLSTAEGLPTLAANRGTEPAKLTKLVRGELDWIVMKALEKDRSRRYETANAFALDIQRYLADEAVEASPPSAGYRLRKFVRRNRGRVLAAAGFAALVVLGIAGLIVGIVAVNAERQRTAQGLERVTAEQTRTQLALAAETRARAAEKQAYDKAMAALRDMTDEFVENQMARGTRLTEENKEFLRKIIKHFEGFAALTADDAESRAFRAEGHARVGLMRHNLGELKEAEAALTAALALRKRLAADFPTRRDFRYRLGGSHTNLGNLLRASGRLKEAEAVYADALAIFKQLVADFPTSPDCRQNLAGCHLNLGTLLSETGRLKRAEAAYAHALGIQKRLAADFPRRPEFRQLLAMSHDSLGTLLRATGRLKEAEAAYADALAICKQLAADFPTTRPEFRHDLARWRNNLGRLLSETGRLRAAEAAFVDALAIQKQLAADFPTRPDFRHELAKSHNSLGRLLSETGRLRAAEAAFADALAIQKRLAADFPTRPDFRQELATSHNDLGNLLHNSGRHREAETAHADALVLWKQLAADFPTRTAFRQGLAWTYNDLGVLLADTGRHREAETAYADALAIRKQLVADFPNQPDQRNQLAGTFVNLASLCNQRRDFTTARSYLHEARPHHQAALEANPRNRMYRLFFRNNLIVLVHANAGLRDQAAAVHAAQKLHDLGWDPPGNAYVAACALARCIPVVEKDDRLGAAKREAAVQFYGDQALAMLRAAVAKGYRNVEYVKESTDLDPLRQREDFRKLLAELEARQKERRVRNQQPER
ncbi:MAG: serine/threonine-protein kinase, partial [Gemmataceae bacterium]|nr:serine/threonine-protein kinase [Gemmataceae bacterium]